MSDPSKHCPLCSGKNLVSGEGGYVIVRPCEEDGGGACICHRLDLLIEAASMGRQGWLDAFNDFMNQPFPTTGTRETFGERLSDRGGSGATEDDVP